MDKDKKQAYTRRITQANSTEMVVILYDMTLDYIEEAAGALGDDHDPSEFIEVISKIQGCISELIESLHMEYKPADELRMLYDFCIRRIAVSQAKRDAAILDEVSRVIRPLRDAYSKIVDKNPGGPVMGNSQTVYAGLTYGKDDLIESLSTNAGRGYLV